VRKRWGGGWRQAGYLAAAGIYALDNHIDRLTEDHQRARAIGELMSQKAEVLEVLPVDTNIVIFTLDNGILSSDYVKKLAEVGIKAATFGKHQVRFVTHLDFTDQDLEEFSVRIKKIFCRKKLVVKILTKESYQGFYIYLCHQNQHNPLIYKHIPLNKIQIV
jgi:threonine aldolase